MSSGNAPSRSSSDDRPGWLAELTLRFGIGEGGVTQLTDRTHSGPLVVQRPFYPEGPDVPHVYVLHPPGGLVGGDRVRLDVTVDRGAHALITTPAAAKFYRSVGPVASQRQSLTVGEGGVLEWLPQETILHDGANADLTTHVTLAPGARFIGIDTLCFGLPARGETFALGRCRQRFEIWRGGCPIVIERGRFDADDEVHAAAWGLGGARVHALLVASPAPQGPATTEAIVARLRTFVAEPSFGDRVGVTVIGGGAALVCRYLGPSAERGRRFLQDAWTALRQPLLGRVAVPPRVWAT